MSIAVAFCLLCHAVGALLLAWGTVACGVRFLAVRSPRFVGGLFLVPLGKGLWDAAAARHGAWGTVLQATPFHGPSRLLLQLGTELSALGPSFHLQLQRSGDPDTWRAISAGGFLWEMLTHHVHPHAPVVVVCMWVGVALARLVRRAVALHLFERMRRTGRRHGACIRTAPVRVFGRPVDFYLCAQRHGTPFAGGVWRPYVCVPLGTWHALTKAERAAVLAHEVAHLRAGDVLVRWWVAVSLDIFWFVPGLGHLQRCIHAAQERCADGAATAGGAQRAALASAIVRVSVGAGAAGVALRGRVEELLVTPPRRIVRGLPVGWLRNALVSVIIAHAALASTAGSGPAASAAEPSAFVLSPRQWVAAVELPATIPPWPDVEGEAAA